MFIRARKATLLAGTIMAGSLIAAPALAQEPGQQGGPTFQAEPSADAAEDSGMIIVTGSRIQRRNTDSAAPIAVVDAEEFQLSGTVNVENVINTLPQVVPGTTSFSNNPGNGAATLNLRGLGSTRTLVLVNGRRWMFYDTNQIVDLNTIPSFLLESVDVVTGGASAVYGSDAIAGVVNFRLRDVEGAEIGAQVDSTQEGDGFRYNVHGAIGSEIADGRGHVTAYGEYFKRQSLFADDRDFSTYIVGNDFFGDPLSRGGSSTVPQGRINFAPSATIRPAFDANGDGEIDADDPNEQALTSPVASGLVFDDAFFETPGVARRRTGSDLYNFAPDNYLQLPQERFLIGGNADYDIGNGHTIYGEVSFVNNRVQTELAPTPVTGTYNLDIDTVSQFLSPAAVAELNQIDQREAAAQAQIDAYNASLGYCGAGQETPDGARACASNLATPQLGLVSAAVQRRANESGSRNQLDERNAFRVLAGVTGPLGEYLNYDAYYLYSRTRNSQIQQGNISRSLFQAGLDGTGTPINIFGPGTLTPEQIAAITIGSQNSETSSLEVTTATLSGTFGDFAFGEAEPVGFAVGVEHRRVAAEYIPDTFLASGDVIGFNAGQPTAGDYSAREIFAELNVPIEFGGMRLDLTGSGRYSDYSLDAVGGVWTYAGGAEFEPVDGIVLRGQYARAIRAPNVADLFQGQAIGFPSAVDPCGNAEFLAANPGADQTCIATGVPAGNVGNADLVQLNAQIPALFGGNPELQEETSDSWTVGVVLQPSFVPGLTITADYFDIVVEDAISIAGGSLQGLLDLCYGTIQDLDNAVCQPFVGVRNSDGAITTDLPPLVSGVNVAELGTSGVDLEVSYGTSVPFAFIGGSGESDLNLGFLGTWTESSFLVPVQGLDDVFECSGEFGGNCGEPTPEFKWTARASWIDGPLTTSVRWRHLGSVDDNDDNVDFAAFNGIETIDSYDLVDLTLALDFLEKYTFTFGVRNLFNTLPDTPLFDANGVVINDTNSLLLGDNQEQSNTYPSTYDVLGRDFFIGVNARF